MLVANVLQDKLESAVKRDHPATVQPQRAVTGSSQRQLRGVQAGIGSLPAWRAMSALQRQADVVGAATDVR